MNSLFKIQQPLRSALTSRFLQRTLAYALNERKVEASPESNPSFIHPTAVVHPDAIIGQGVSVGPFCTVGSSAKIGNGCKLYPSSHIFGDTKLGDRCVLMTYLSIFTFFVVVIILDFESDCSLLFNMSPLLGSGFSLSGSGAVVGDDIPGSTVIGCDNVIGHHAVVGVRCQDLKYKLGDECFLDIGDNNDIREHISIHRSSKPTDKTVIGDDNLIMGSSHIAHDCKIGNSNIFANNTLLAGHVVVGDYAHTAGATVVHQFCHIGSFSFIGGGSVVSQDVPIYAMVSGERAALRGLNFEGLRRHGFTVAEIRSLRKAYRKIFVTVNSDSSSIEERLLKVEHDEELKCVPAVGWMVQSLRGSFAETRRGICNSRRWSSS